MNIFASLLFGYRHRTTDASFPLTLFKNTQTMSTPRSCLHFPHTWRRVGTLPRRRMVSILIVQYILSMGSTFCYHVKPVLEWYGGRQQKIKLRSVPKHANNRVLGWCDNSDRWRDVVLAMVGEYDTKKQVRMRFLLVCDNRCHIRGKKLTFCLGVTWNDYSSRELAHSSLFSYKNISPYKRQIRIYIVFCNCHRSFYLKYIYVYVLYI